MPMQMGTLMVSIRAQDFASRTLRRVNAEFGNLSRTQQVAAMGERAAAMQSAALTRQAMAQSQARRIQYVRDAQVVRSSFAAQTKAIEDFESLRNQVFRGGRFAPGVDRRVMRDWQNVSAAVRQAGLQGVLAERRLKAAAEAAMAATPVSGTRVSKRDRAIQAEATRELRNAERAYQSTFGRDGAAALNRFRAAQNSINEATAAGLAPTRAMRAELQASEQAWKNVDGAAARGLRTYERFGRQVRNIDQRIGASSFMNRIAMSSEAMGNAVFRSRRELVRAEAALTDAQRAQLAYNRAAAALPIIKVDQFAHALSGIGRTMQLFGAIGTLAFGGAALQAADFSKSVTLAATQMARLHGGEQLAVTQTAALRDGILKLSRQLPFAAKDMADAIYEIFSSTNIQSIQGGMKLLEAVGRVAVAGQTDIMTATKATILTLNDFRGASQDIGGTLSRMFAIVRYGQITFSQFATMLPKVAAAAYGSGQSLDDMAGIMAFLTRRTGSASIAATQISRAFDVFTRAEFRDGMKKLDVQIENVHGHLLPLPKILEAINRAWGKQLSEGGPAAERFIQLVTRVSNEAGRGFLSTSEARRFFRFIFSNYKEYAHLQQLSVDNNEQFRIQFERMMKDPGVQWDVFVARIKAGIIAIGQAAIPAFAEIGKQVAKFLDWWEGIDQATRNNVVRWGVFISVGTLVAGVLSAITGALVSVSIGMARVLGPLARALFWFTGLGNLLGRTGAAGLVGRTLVFAKILGFLASIGAIEIGIKLKMQGDSPAWKLLGMTVSTAGAANLLKKAGLTGAKRFPIAATLMELMFPESAGAGEMDFAKFTGMLNEMDKNLAGQVNRKKLLRTQKAATELFYRTLRAPGGTFEGAKQAVLDYLKSVHVSLGDNADDLKSHSQSFNEWLKDLSKSTSSAAFNQLLKKMGLDKSSLTGSASAFDKYNEKLKTYNSNLRQFQQDSKEWQQRLSDATRQAATDTVENLRNMYTQMEEVNRQAMGDLFKGPFLTSETFDLAQEWGITPQAVDVIKDMRMQITSFETRMKNLAALGRRGLPAEMLDELRKMPADEANPLIDALKKAPPGQIREIVRLWNRRQADIKKQTRVDFTSEIQHFRRAGLNMGLALTQGFQNARVAKWFDTWIKGTFPGVINSAVNQAVKDFKTQNPRPVAPRRPTPPRTRRPAATPATRRPQPTRRAAPRYTGAYGPGHPPPATVGGQPQTHYTFNQNFYGITGTNDIRDVARKAGFHARNAVKGRGK